MLGLRQQLLCHKLEAPFEVSHGRGYLAGRSCKSTSVMNSCLNRNCDKEESRSGTANMRHLPSNPSPFAEPRGTDSTGIPGHFHDAVCSMLLELKHVETLFCQGVWSSVICRWRQCCWPIDYFNTDWFSVMKEMLPRVFMLATQPRICLVLCYSVSATSKSPVTGVDSTTTR